MFKFKCKHKRFEPILTDTMTAWGTYGCPIDIAHPDDEVLIIKCADCGKTLYWRRTSDVKHSMRPAPQPCEDQFAAMLAYAKGKKELDSEGGTG